MIDDLEIRRWLIQDTQDTDEFIIVLSHFRDQAINEKRSLMNVRWIENYNGTNPAEAITKHIQELEFFQDQLEMCTKLCTKFNIELNQGTPFVDLWMKPNDGQDLRIDQFTREYIPIEKFASALMGRLLASKSLEFGQDPNELKIEWTTLVNRLELFSDFKDFKHRNIYTWCIQEIDNLVKWKTDIKKYLEKIEKLGEDDEGDEDPGDPPYNKVNDLIGQLKSLDKETENLSGWKELIKFKKIQGIEKIQAHLEQEKENVKNIQDVLNKQSTFFISSFDIELGTSTLGTEFSIALESADYSQAFSVLKQFLNNSNPYTSINFKNCESEKIIINNWTKINELYNDLNHVLQTQNQGSPAWQQKSGFEANSEQSMDQMPIESENNSIVEKYKCQDLKYFQTINACLLDVKATRGQILEQNLPKSNFRSKRLKELEDKEKSISQYADQILNKFTMIDEKIKEWSKICNKFDYLEIQFAQYQNDKFWNKKRNLQKRIEIAGELCATCISADSIAIDAKKQKDIRDRYNCA